LIGGHRRHSDGGYSDTSSGGSFLDENDREVCSLTDRAFRSLCIGDEAVYNDSDLSLSSPCTQRDRQLAFSQSGQDREDGEDREREELKRAARENFSLKVQQYGQDWSHGRMYGGEIHRDPQWEVHGERTQGRISATFQHSVVETSQKETSLKEERLNFLSNGATELSSQQRKSNSRVSSLIRAFNSERNRDGVGIDDKIREWKDETSWDKSALMSIQRELSEFSTSYQQNFHSSHFPSSGSFSYGDNNLHSFGSDVAAVSHSSASSFMRSSHNKQSMCTQVNCNSNVFIHSEFSPFKVWRDHNRFPFQQGQISGFMHRSEFAKWYETPMYKEPSQMGQPQGHYTGIRRPRSNLAPMISPSLPRSTSTSTVLQNASAVEKQQNITTEVTENQQTVLYRKENVSLGNNAVTVAPKAMGSNTSTTPFNISQLLTPLVHAHQEAVSSDLQHYATSPQPVEHSPVRAESRGVTPDIRMSTYKSRATSLLFNLKDNRKRVKSTYSPTKFKAAETSENNKQPPTHESRDTVIDIPEFPDSEIQFSQLQESSRTNAAVNQEEERRAKEREAVAIKIKERREKQREAERSDEETKFKQKEEDIRAEQREEKVRMKEIEEKKNRRIEEQQRAAQEEQQRKAAQEEQQKRAAQEEQQRKVAQEEQQKRAAQEEQQRKAAQEEQQRRAVYEEQQKRAVQEEQLRRAQEEKQRAAEELKRRAAQEEHQRRAVQEEQQRRAVYEEQQRRAQEEKQRVAEELKRRAAQEEQQRRAAQEEQQRRAAQEEQQRRAAQEDIAMEEDDSRSLISNMSEDVESFATSAADLADIRGLYDYERPESACSFSSDVSRSLGKPPAVPPKSEKALRRAQRLTTRRMKKDLPSTHTEHHSFHASPHATGPISIPHTAAVSLPGVSHYATGPASHTAAPKTVAHVPSSPTFHQAHHPAPVTQYHVESSYPQAYPLTQRKVLQDPGSGQYFVVDLPVQVKKKTFFDPQTGKYIQLNVRESGKSISQPQPQQTWSHGYLQHYQPASINSLHPNKSQVPSTLHQNQQPGHQAFELGQNSEGHRYSPEKTPYMDTVNDKDKTYNTIYSTHGSYESLPECDTNSQLAGNSVCENDNSAHSQYNPRDIIAMSELEDFMEVSDW
uniref:DUF4585 domain-containing protein n=1 Tax=Pundamilia nyererei TaxID=303518 RepID=A0A3B4FUN1_9CICH